eukprot:scaffold121620_cov28-Tisochrysis_lutea.AAC.2
MDSVSVALGANCCADSSTIASRGVIRESTYLRAAGPPSPKMSAGPVIHSDGAKSGIAPTADVTNCCGCDGSAYWKASEIKALASSNACAGTPRSRSRRRYEKRRESTVLHSASPFSVSENDIVTTAKARVSSSTPTCGRLADSFSHSNGGVPAQLAIFDSRNWRRAGLNLGRRLKPGSTPAHIHLDRRRQALFLQQREERPLSPRAEELRQHVLRLGRKPRVEVLHWEAPRGRDRALLSHGHDKSRIRRWC